VRRARKDFLERIIGRAYSSHNSSLGGLCANIPPCRPWCEYHSLQNMFSKYLGNNGSFVFQAETNGPFPTRDLLNCLINHDFGHYVLILTTLPWILVILMALLPWILDNLRQYCLVFSSLSVFH